MTTFASSTVNQGAFLKAKQGKKLLGWVLAIMAVLVLTGFDKVLETWALQVLPDWAINL